MSYWQKVQSIVSKEKEIGTESVRKLSEATGYSKSSIHRHHQAQARRNQYPESQLWESAEGQQWLMRLMVASLLDLGVKRGVGAESLSSFFAHLRIDTHVGISPSALRGIQKKVEALIIEYGEVHQKQYRTLLQQFSQSVHPFAITDSAPQTSAVVTEHLQTTVAELETLAKTNDLTNSCAKLKPVKNQLPDLASLMDVWWDWVDHSLADQLSDFSHKHWLTHIFLPTVYWECQLANARSEPQRQSYQLALNYALNAFYHHPFTSHFQAQALEHWSAWANAMVSRFQRTSSPVEGRNGYLSQVNHASRGLPHQRLKTLTVLHNFELTRHDGSTAAQRFFGCPFPDFFEWLLPRMPDLPLPRIRPTGTLPHPSPSSSLPVPPYVYTPRFA